MLSRHNKFGSHNLEAEKFHQYWIESKEIFQKVPKELPIDNMVLSGFQEHGVSSWSTLKSREVAEEIYRRLVEQDLDEKSCWDNSLRYKEDVLRTFPELEEVFTDSLSDFLYSYYGTYFKIYYGLLYKSVYRSTLADGSSIWHRDGGPGTCINIMYAINPVSKRNGALQCISKKHTSNLIKETNRLYRKLEFTGKLSSNHKTAQADRRKVISDHIDWILNNDGSVEVVQPTGDAGLIIPFLNNSFHRGGYPECDEIRYVCLFHIYPSKERPNWTRYKSNGIQKVRSFPLAPDQQL